VATAHDVAAYILQLRGPMSAIKLQKLVYYSYAWHLVWEEDHLFDAHVEAWANGPVVRELYHEHRGKFMLDGWPQGDASALTESEQETVRAVLDFYGDKTAAWLSELTHKERPWLDARQGLTPGERGAQPISDEAMAEYYGSLLGTA
jgi:uncharacterized phage-associated protein